jgi:2-succinyl-6-hydroxy-2,4-cyclohexadiene-1-carboxylate synthase
MRSVMLHYQTYGSPEKRALCFLHGFMGSTADWDPIVEALEADAYCLMVDLPGHGRSVDRPPHEYTMEGATQALADVLDEVGIDRCSLVGYSMGGRVALYFSVHHPSRVQRLVLESASPGLRTEEARGERRALDAERAARIQNDLPCFLHDWYRKPLFSSLEHHGLVESMIERRQDNDPGELARALKGLGPGTQPSLWEELETVRGPALVMTGALDEKYEDLTRETAQLLPDARRVLVPRAGHNVHAERPQAYLAELCRFLADT